jgi:DNA-binding transcriptional MerR regulator
MDETWTLAELVAEAASWIATLPEPKNGQVRAVPDERTIRYYAALGLLDRPTAMRGRTALYSRRHLAQVIAIKRLQGTGKSLADIQTMWPTLDDLTLGRLTGVQMPARSQKARAEFWKRAPESKAETPKVASAPPVEVRIELAPNVHVAVALPEGASLTSADVHALRAAAAPFVAELARRGLTP